MSFVSNILSFLGKAALFALIVATIGLITRVEPVPVSRHAGELDAVTENLASLAPFHAPAQTAS